MRDGWALGREGIDPAHPRKLAYLQKAVGLVTGGEEVDLAELRSIEENITSIAATFNAEATRSGEGARRKTVSAHLQAIEDACAKLAEAFDGASHAAYDALGGHGIGGYPLRTLGAVIGDPNRARRNVMAALAGRYRLPIAPTPSTETLEAWTDDPDTFDVERLPALADWPVAVRALAEVVRAQREDFEQHFRPEVARFNDLADRGPDGTLRPPAQSGRGRKVSAKAKPAKVLHNDPASAPDLGGKENVSDQMRGQPKWTLAYECCGYLRRWWPEEEMKGPPDGRAYEFTLAVYAYATGEDVREVKKLKGAGEYDAGLGHHVRAALKIGGALAALNLRRAMSGPSNPFTEEERRQHVSLERAAVTGRVPNWQR